MQKIDAALLIIRVSFGCSMAFHGYNKVVSGLEGTAGWFQSIGMKWPRTQARIAAFTEIVAGALLAVGLLTPLAAMSFISLMIVAIMTVHWKVGYFIFLPNGGWEYCASIVAVASALCVSGPGGFSIDNVLGLSTDISWVGVPVAAILALCHLAISYRPSSK